MSESRGPIWRALTESAAATRPEHDDPRLRGRTYPVPFERVWQTALHLAGGALRRWRVLEADDQRGVIRAEGERLLLRSTDEVMIRISLDENGQTRVDASSTARTGRADLGANARRLDRFFKAMDRELGRA